MDSQTKQLFKDAYQKYEKELNTFVLNGKMDGDNAINCCGAYLKSLESIDAITEKEYKEFYTEMFILFHRLY